MRMSQLNLTPNPRKFFEHDARRGIFMLRNTDAAIIIRVQFGQPGSINDFFPILPGDTFTLDRGDLTQEIYIMADTAMSNNQSAVG